MYAFVDETGNTGANLFDEAQPDFHTGALVTRADFDVVWGPKIRALCKRHGFDALHGSVLGFDAVEAIARDLTAIVSKADARFFVARVEKRYLLATKLFDTFFDSGENPAVAWTTYNIRMLRLILSFKVATLITEDIAKQFWTMLMAKQEAAARALIPSICDALLQRVHRLPDQRSQEVVTDALTWSRAHPQALDIFVSSRQAKNGHLPNMVAFVNLLDGLERLSKLWKRSVRKIVHDRQSQFEASLAEWHRMYSNASPEPIHRPGETYTLQKVAGSQFEISASDASPGIQVVDIALWLYRQLLAGKDLKADSVRLIQYVLRRGWHSDFSFDGVGRVVEKRYREFMELDIPAEKMEAGARIRETVEQQRQRAMELYEKDGLMPYQREGSLRDSSAEAGERLAGQRESTTPSPRLPQS